MGQSTEPSQGQSRGRSLFRGSRARALLLLIGGVVALASVGGGLVMPLAAQLGNSGPSASNSLYDPEAGSPRAWAEERLRAMSLEDKVGQLFVVPVFGENAHTVHPRNQSELGVDTAAQAIERYGVGGVIHFSWTESLKNPQQIARLSNELQDAALNSGARIPLANSTDQEQGSITRIEEPVTPLPGNMALGASRSEEDAARAAAISARELRAIGINQNFAPSADVNVNPQNPVIGVRSFSADPELVSTLTAAQVRGYQGQAPKRSPQEAEDQQHLNSVSAVVKHFPGHGDTNQDSHVALPVIEHDRQEWEQLDAPPFRSAIEAQPDAIMSAHIVMPKLDNSGEPATLSRNVLTGMLRQELGYQGVITTDSLRMEGVRSKHTDAEIPVLALQAGADQLLMPVNLPLARDSVLRAVRSGQLTEQRIDESVLRILEMKAKRGIATEPLVDLSRVDKVVGAPEHRRDAQVITDRTTTLLRNEGQLLPVRPQPAQNSGQQAPRMLVAGAGEDAVPALAQHVQARGIRTTSQVSGNKPSPEMIQRTVEAAKQHDVTVVLTNRAWDPSRSTQRDLLEALKQANVRVIAVATRDAYDAGYVDVPAWLATYSAKPIAMESLAKVLVGENAPQGKLPVDVPDPAQAAQPKYPFGHGLTW